MPDAESKDWALALYEPIGVLSGSKDDGRAWYIPRVVDVRLPEKAPGLHAVSDQVRRDWRRDAAAKALGINRATLYKKAKRLGVELAGLGRGPTAPA